MINEQSYKKQSEKTARYYDEWQEGYNEIYGDTIQAFRPNDKDALMQYIAHSIGIEGGVKILDAGCGVGGPAIWLAEKYDVQVNGVTISSVQVAQAQQSIAKKNIGHKVQVTKGDYHELDLLFSNNSFDRILFLESLGHSGDPAKALEAAFSCLKLGGYIYIKDFYYKEPKDVYWKSRIEKTISNINKAYHYNTLRLNDTIDALRRLGFEIEFIRKFGFVDDVSIRFEFEKKFGIDIFGGEEEFYPAEWLEIKCIKP